MKKTILIVVTALLALPVAQGLAETKASKAKTKAQRLVDAQLDRITAGDAEVDGVAASGGAIVGNASTATIKTSGAVSLDSGAQGDARALNLVNAAESGVANAVNVWDGRLDTQTAETELNVNQENLILQRQARSASVPAYIRPEANIDETFSSTRDVTTNGTVETLAQALDLVEVRAGKGISGSGSISLDIDGGSLEFTNNINSSIEANAGASVLGGLLDVNGEVEATFDTTQTLTWVLPDLSFSAEGSACAVAMGSCTAQGTDSSTSSGTRSVRSPFALYGAQAEYIVVDDSSLDAETDYSVLLASNAQQNARALNLVNAAGSVVANAVNVARTPTVGPVLNLNQVNTIIQVR